MSIALSAELLCATSYDYVIAGGGTAGLTLAARLSEDPDISVAVIEAGEDRSGDLPVNAWGLTGTMLGDPRYDWAFSTVPQPFDDNRVISWPRGRQLGGSSSLNFWYWNHASRADIDGWEKLGNNGWNWDSLFPYFLKSESYDPPSEQLVQELGIFEADSSDRGENGPVKTSFPPVAPPLAQAWNPTFENLGLAFSGDPYDGLALGSYTTLISQDLKNVSRSSATTAYYKPNSARPNLRVITGALANKIIFQDHPSNGEPLVASGLSFTHGGKTYEIEAKREVILSAGVVQSPQLLELSGIGDASLLESLDINVLFNNTHVGENLQDHVFISLTFEVADGVDTLDLLRDPQVLEQERLKYITNRTGLLAEATSSTAYLSLEQLLRTSKVDSVLSKDSSAYKAPAEDVLRDPGLSKQYELVTSKLLDPKEPVAQELYNRGALIFPAPKTGSYVSMLGLLSHPYSRGSIHINSSDPTAYPVIDPRFLSSSVDLEVLTSIAFHLETIATTQPFASLLKGNGTVYAPGDERLTKANVKQHVKNRLGELQHPLGTCAMQPQDKSGVVDTELKVYGTKNLRVVDASVIPIQPVGTIQSLVYAVAEKAADIIKAAQH
ncbi:MAG: hypothetical protein M1825_005960 [Sarcosagium campestre]|nr:MAG: hypothetical protein M1825_005960 [Sarcosagium campestre]